MEIAAESGLGTGQSLPFQFRRSSYEECGAYPPRSARPYNRVTLSLTLGTRLGPYQVVSAIGAGGMDI